MLVADLIGDDVHTCSPTLSAEAAASQMIAQEIGSLAVVEDDKLVGIVTERDLLKVMAGQAPHRAKVEDVMTHSPDSLNRDVEIADAAEWILSSGYRHMPVVEGSRLIGMVSIKDVLSALTQQG